MAKRVKKPKPWGQMCIETQAKKLSVASDILSHLSEVVKGIAKDYTPKTKYDVTKTNLEMMVITEKVENIERLIRKYGA